MLAENQRIAVMSALAVEMAFTRFIIPEFEAETGIALDMDWAPTAVLMRRIAGGERADVILAIDGSMDELEAAGIVLAETRVPVARSLLGVAVKAGARRPDISSPQSFADMLISVNKVAYSEGGASGIYFAGLIERLGIADAVRANAITIPAGFTAEKIVTGEAEVAIQQISELMSVPGIEILGPFPDALQSVVELSAAVFSDAANPSAARTFVSALAAPQSRSAYEKGGLAPRLSVAS